jgi:hypothetical protein
VPRASDQIDPPELDETWATSTGCLAPSASRWCSGYYEDLPDGGDPRVMVSPPDLRRRFGIGSCSTQLHGTTRRRVEAADVELHRDRLRFPEVVRRHHEGVARALAVLRERERRLSSRQRRVDGLVRRRPR